MIKLRVIQIVSIVVHLYKACEQAGFAFYNT